MLSIKILEMISVERGGYIGLRRESGAKEEIAVPGGLMPSRT
jgi:hypothetical protein